MDYTKIKLGDIETQKPQSVWSTDDNIYCKDGKTLRENLTQIKNYSLVIHTDGKLYIKKEDGTLLGEGIEIENNNIDLSTLSLSISGQTLRLMNGGTQLSTVTIPSANVTNKQLQGIIQGFIEDGTLSSLTIENGSIADEKLKLHGISANKISDFSSNINYISQLDFSQMKDLNTATGEITDTSDKRIWTSDYFLIPEKLKNNIYVDIKNYGGGSINIYYVIYDTDKSFIKGGILTKQTRLFPENGVYCVIKLLMITPPTGYDYNQRTINNLIYFGEYDEQLSLKMNQSKTSQLTEIKVKDDNTITDIWATKLEDDLLLSDGNINNFLTKENYIRSGILEQGVNLFDINSALPSTGVDSNGDFIPSNSSRYAMQIMVEENTEYTFNTVGVWSLREGYWLDDRFNVISKVEQEVTSQTSPTGAKYFRGQKSFTGNLLDDKVMFYKGTDAKDYIPYSVSFTKKYLPYGKTSKDWSNYIYMALGDSRTAGYASNLSDTTSPTGYKYDKAYTDVNDYGWSYPRDIKYNTGINLINLGMSGSTFAKYGTSTNYQLNYVQDKITSNLDIVTIHAGTNDRVAESNPQTNQVLLDNADDKYDITTFKGSIRALIKYIRLANPYVSILFLVDTNDKQKDKWIEEVAEELNCEAVPLYKKKNICKLFNSDIVENGFDPYYSDGLHESVAGHKVLGKIVAGEMMKYLW